MKRQPIVQEKISANHTLNKRLVSKTYKQLIKFNSEKANNPIKI